MLSNISRAPVIPCYISGSHQILSSDDKFFNKGKLRVYYGEPLGPPDMRKDSKKTDYFKFVGEVMQRIKALKDEAEKH